MDNQKEIYCFILDENKKFYSAVQHPNGDYTISSNAQPYPIKFNPTNIINTPIEFATNSKYFSLNRSISYPLDFIKDGAAILRYFYYSFGKHTEQKLYLAVIQWNGTKNIYELSYNGKFDFSQKKDDPKSGKFTIPTIDDSAWGVLSQNDTVTYSIDCSPSNPAAIRVLFDGITLLNKATFQTVDSEIQDIRVLSQDRAETRYYPIPFVLINQDGDSYGVLLNNQIYNKYTNRGDLISAGNWFFSSVYSMNAITITGTIDFITAVGDYKNIDLPIKIYFYIYQGSNIRIFSVYLFGSGIDYFISKTGVRYNKDFSFNVDIVEGTQIFFIAEFSPNASAYTKSQTCAIIPTITNVVVETKTISQPVVRYGLRPLDFLKQLVAKATNNRYTIDSTFFTVNNKSIILSGDSIRNIPNAKIYSSFYDFFQTFDAINFMALKNNNGSLSIEKATEVYKDNTDNIVDLGEIIDLQLIPASEYMANEIEVGSPKQDYRHPSGRLEFNSVNTFSLDVHMSSKKLSFVSKYRLGCYDIQFLIMDYQGSSTVDNTGDKSVYVAEITDEIGSATQQVETFENVNIDSAPLEPIIKSPLNNDTIGNTLPIIRGIAPSGSTVNIYSDQVLDGSTVADITGRWNYQLVNPLSSYELDVHTGLHVIDASFGTESDPKTTISILIDTTNETPTKIIYPQTGDYLYNNLPIIKGVSKAGTVLPIILNGINIGSVTADNSEKWIVDLQNVLPNGNNTITVGDDSVSFTVNSNVTYPLITYIGSELDGFPIINNLPIIKGVAIPGTMVSVWLDYLNYKPLGTVLADANGDWEFQVVPLTYPDPVSGISQVLAPIKNGLNVISTSLVNQTVNIGVSGYKLNRPNFTEIDGVIDNTVFNTSYSPKRMLLNHAPMLAPIGSNLYFQTADKNADFKTVLNNITIDEDTDVSLSSLGKPLALFEYANIKTSTQNTFSKTLYNFNNGGLVKASYRGTDLYMLPIGNMKMNDITNEVQNWKLLLSSVTSYSSLLNLYKEGTIINIMKNSIYHSNYNTLHFVTYNYQDNPKYNFKELYDDWFMNRNSAWSTNPDYIQKVQRTDPVIDQIISNGISGIKLYVYRCRDAVSVGSFDYITVSPSPINLGGSILMQAVIDLTQFPEDEYFFVMAVGNVNAAISERVSTKDKWDNTVLIESYNSLNKPLAYFSTGFIPNIRVEGLVKKLQPALSNLDVALEDNGDTEMLYSSLTNKRIVRFGTAYGLPDYIYLKIAALLVLDNLKIEGVSYTMDKDEKIQPSDDVDGHPLYYYNVTLDLKYNSSGLDVLTASDSNNSVVLVVDAAAFGLPAGGLVNINLDNE